MGKNKSEAVSEGGFSPASFAKLLAVAGSSNNEPLRIDLSDIDEDPDQPRKAIDMDELELLAATISSHGVLQPIGVYPPVEGRYRLAFGARRLRASLIAKRLDIPAIIVPEAQRNYASQVIENQHRADLKNSDLVAAVVQLQAEGASATQIGVICNLKEHQVTAYRAVAKFPPFLSERLNTADVRALYDLYRQWGKTPAEVMAGMPENDGFLTITEARRIIAKIASRATDEIVDDADSMMDTENDSRERNTDRPVSRPVTVPALDEILHSAEFSSETAEPEIAVKALSRPGSKGGEDRSDHMKPVFIVAIGGGEHGQLIVDRCGKAAGWALVRFPTGIEEVEFTKLRTVAIE